ncbi:hypothetical protein ACFVYF_23605 [Streptomyces sp. NPDC058274]|uniref:hypothetical protein n=1 Tax=Streptomyces sp. NPDC058274 TaxID=3346416 RepID=UPI0036EAEBC4
MKPHAEIAEVWPRDGCIRLVGHLHGRSVRDTDDWQLLLVRRARTDRCLRYKVRLTGDRFESELPLADLSTDDQAEAGEWDIHLTDGEAQLRAGRQLDDIRDKKKIMVFPEQCVGRLRVRPYYTVKNNLSLKCRTGGDA